MSEKATKPRRRRRNDATVPTRDDRDGEKRALLGEIALLTDQQDALKEEIAHRKDKLLLLMSQDGDRSVEADGIGTAGFQRRRSFKVKDATLLSTMFPGKILAENIKITAALYDAAEREGYRIAEAVTQGEDESLTVTRARTKEAKKMREAHITEARKKAEHAVAAYRNQLKQF